MRPVRIETTGTQDRASVIENFARAFSHRLVDTIPREGLLELIEQLIQIYEFYSARNDVKPQLPAPYHSRKAKLSASVIRPTFSIEEDE